MDKKFKKYKLKKSDQSADEICKPKKFNLQPSQKFLGEYFSSNIAERNLLIYHKIGAGKTCTAINIAENLKNKMKIVVVVPAALIGNFRDELRSQCPGDVYLKENERKKFKDPNSSSYKKLLEVSDKRIDRYYEIYSYHKFIDQQTWIDFGGGFILGYKLNKHLGVFMEGKYNKYWNRQWHDFSVGLNYVFF